ncbi:MAG: hypothetical protein ACRC2T_01090 [Thermoguttaceae bacterium]
MEYFPTCSPVHLLTINDSRPTGGDSLHAKRIAWTAGPLLTCSPVHLLH